MRNIHRRLIVPIGVARRPSSEHRHFPRGGPRDLEGRLGGDVDAVPSAAHDRNMLNDSRRRVQYSVKWALGQLTLCGVAFAFVPAFWASVSDYRVPNNTGFLGVVRCNGRDCGWILPPFSTGRFDRSHRRHAGGTRYCLHHWSLSLVSQSFLRQTLPACARLAARSERRFTHSRLFGRPVRYAHERLARHSGVGRPRCP